MGEDKSPLRLNENLELYDFNTRLSNNGKADIKLFGYMQRSPCFDDVKLESIYLRIRNDTIIIRSKRYFDMIVMPIELLRIRLYKTSKRGIASWTKVELYSGIQKIKISAPSANNLLDSVSHIIAHPTLRFRIRKILEMERINLFKIASKPS